MRKILLSSALVLGWVALLSSPAALAADLSQECVTDAQVGTILMADMAEQVGVDGADLEGAQAPVEMAILSGECCSSASTCDYVSGYRITCGSPSCGGKSSCRYSRTFASDNADPVGTFLKDLEAARAAQKLLDELEGPEVE